MELDLSTPYGWLTAAHLADQMLRGAARWASASLGGRAFGVKSLRSPHDVPRKGKLVLSLQAATPPPPPVLADKDSVWMPSCLEMLRQELDPPFARLIGGQHIALLRAFAADHQLSTAAAHELLDLMPTRWDKARALAVLVARVPLSESLWFGALGAGATGGADIPDGPLSGAEHVGPRRLHFLPMRVSVCLNRREILTEMAEVQPLTPANPAVTILVNTVTSPRAGGGGISAVI